MSDESPKDPSQPDPNGDPNQPNNQVYGDGVTAPKFERAVDYMETEKGHAVTLRLLTMLEQNAPALNALLEAKIESYRARPKLEFRKWVWLLVVRFMVFGTAIGALIYMRKTGTIDPAIAILIGGLVAYFFGYNRSQS